MAAPTGTFTTYAGEGLAEDVSDIIYDISPTATPFLSSIARNSATAVLHQFQTDELATATSGNAAEEGAAAATNTAVATVMWSNPTQILDKVPRVTGTMRKVKTYGRGDDLTREIAKRGKELKNDLEKTLLSGNAGTAGTASAARTMAGVGAWLFDNVQKIGTAQRTTVTITNGYPSTAVVHSTTGSAPTETHLKALLADIWSDGGDPTMVLCDATNKAALSGFTGVATQYRESKGMKQGTILGASDLYISDFGEHSIVADKFMDDKSIYAIDPDYWAVSYLRPMQTTPLAKDGDSDRVQLLCEVTLEARNAKSSGKIYSTL